MEWDAGQSAVLALAPTASGVIVGAPGSGKTELVVERARRLVDAGLDPDALLVLTPTRQTATALRDRLALAVGRATSGPLARSVASFAFQLVRAAEVRAGNEPPQLLTGGDEDQILHDLLEGDRLDEQQGLGRWPDWLPADIRSTKGFRDELRAFLAECTTLGIEPDRLRALADEHEVNAWRALASFQREYHGVRAGLRGAHRDSAGLVREALGLVRSDAAGLGPFSGLRAVLVDDAQELTLGGIELLEACAARGVAVLAAGDPDIGSGAFRGATPENFARLARSLGGIHPLTGQHRGTAAQTALARDVTQRIGAVGVVAHRAAPRAVAPDGTVRALVTRSPSEEYDAIARLLRERHVHDGVAWSECAVIAHDTRQVVALEAELAARDVPTRAAGPGRPLGTLAPVRDLLLFIELALSDPAQWSPELVSGVLGGSAGGLDPIALRRLRSSLRHEELAAAPSAPRSGRELLASALAHRAEFLKVDSREARRAARVSETIEKLRDQWERGATVHELLWLVWERAGLERAWGEAARGTGPLADQAGRDLDAVVALFQAAKRFVERRGEELVPGDAMVFVRGIRDSDVAEDRLGAPERAAAVRVLTPAAAIGLEFDTVVVAGVQDGVWPNTRLRGSLLETWRLASAAAPIADRGAAALGILDRRRGAMHDELRLFVRAVSRARSRLVVTAVDDDDSGPSVLFELLGEAEQATRAMEHPLSLRGLVARHRRALTDPAALPRERAVAPGQLALLAEAGVPGAAVAQWYGMREPTTDAPLRDLSREDVRVSPSRLHALEECELNWAIGDLGGDAGGAATGLGTIIHSALEHATGPGEEALWRVVEARWGELEFESAWRARAEWARARDLVRRLDLYLRRFEDEGGRLIGAEPHFEVAIPLDDGEAFDHGVVLSGYIDRVELTPEGSVVIVDLKTGKSEPTSDAKVADNPQLAAYQLAFESGAIGQAAGLPSGGAKLLVLSTGSSKPYATPCQPPFDDDTRAAFVGRVRAAVSVMRGAAFAAPYEEHCRDDYSHGLCRIHTVKAVSAS
ncbi:MAG: ATP-dependent DNA helicase [Microbacterium sp.]|uniref:ATP-dependent helicase n=1 Tax=Microbacterium sp. TaxID=51671 RepID=UPI0039E49FDF